MIVESAIFPLGRANVDTDQIIPASRLTGISKTGLGMHLFAGMTGGAELLAANSGAAILVAGENFGCGSSREHAVWALVDRNIRVVVAPSFARIFSENAYANGLVPVVLSEPDVARLLARKSARVDVAGETIVDDGGGTYTFALDPMRKRFLLEGGFMEFLAARIPEIRAWEARREAELS